QARAHPEKADIWPALASDLRQLWGPGLRRQVEDSASPAARDRLSRIVDTFARFERPDANPAVQRYQDQAVAFWQWQGERYQYDRQDLQNLVADAGQR